jgi:hypothetical protein
MAELYCCTLVSMRPSLVGVALSATSWFVTAVPAFAQTPKLPVLVVDLRGATAGLGTDDHTATDLTSGAAEAAAAGLTVPKVTLPGRGLAFTGGIHVYPFRRHGFAIGLGAEAIAAHVVAKGGTDVTGTVTPEINRRLQGAAAVVSVNFGGRDGWSYLSGGAGPLRFESTSSDIAHTTAPARMTQNVGGGARWFTNEHVAATFDVRAYLTRPTKTELTVAGRERKRVMVFSVGISIR